MNLVFHKKEQPRGLLGLGLAFGAVLLTGCVRPDDVRTSHQIDLPEHYVSTDAKEGQGPLQLEGWTADFQNEAVEALVLEALQNNRNLKVAAARVEEAKALAWIQTGAMLPSVSAGGNGVRSRVNVPDGFGGKNKSLGNAYAASLDLSWEIDLWGKLNNRRRAAGFDYRGQEDTYRAAQLSLSGQVINGWFGLVEAEEQLKLAEETEESFSRAERMVRSRYEQGLRRALDVRLSASNAASAEALTAARREQVKAASTRLEVLLGRYPAGSLSGDGVLPKLDVQWTDELPSSLLARRPDLSAAHAQAVAAELRGSAALKDMLPSLRLTGSGGYQDGELKDLEDPANLIWSLAGGIINLSFRAALLKRVLMRPKLVAIRLWPNTRNRF